jgi:membrane protein DedA with SNARE-associated domain
LIQSVSLWFDSILYGNYPPVIIALALILTTFLLEDVAIAAGVALAAQGTLGWVASFAAVAFGIALGDLLLYGLGKLALKWPWLYQHYLRQRHNRLGRLEQLIHERLALAVILARIIPGMRLLTYVYCGYIHVPFLAFASWVTLSVTVWTAALYLLSLSIGKVIVSTFGIPLSLAVMIPMILLAIVAHILGSRKQSNANGIHVKSAKGVKSAKVMHD